MTWWKIASSAVKPEAAILEGLTAVISLKILEILNLKVNQNKLVPTSDCGCSNFIYNKLSYYLTENKEFAIT